MKYSMAMIYFAIDYTMANQMLKVKKLPYIADIKRKVDFSYASNAIDYIKSI